MTTVDLFPDAEAVVIAGLLDDDGLADVVGDRISTHTGEAVTRPYLTVQRIGGIPAERHRLDRPRLQVDCWGSTRAEASDLAALARVALYALEGRQLGGAVITDVADVEGQAWDPDTTRTPAWPRFRFGVAVTLHHSSTGS